MHNPNRTGLRYDERGHPTTSLIRGKYADYDEYLDAKYIADHDDYREDDEGDDTQVVVPDSDKRYR